MSTCGPVTLPFMACLYMAVFLKQWGVSEGARVSVDFSDPSQNVGWATTMAATVVLEKIEPKLKVHQGDDDISLPSVSLPSIIVVAVNGVFVAPQIWCNAYTNRHGGVTSSYRFYRMKRSDASSSKDVDQEHGEKSSDVCSRGYSSSEDGWSTIRFLHERNIF